MSDIGHVRESLNRALERAAAGPIPWSETAVQMPPSDQLVIIQNPDDKGRPTGAVFDSSTYAWRFAGNRKRVKGMVRRWTSLQAIESAGAAADPSA